MPQFPKTLGTVQLQLFVLLALTQGLAQNLPAVVAIKQGISTLDSQRQVILSGIQVSRYTARRHVIVFP